MQFGVIKHKDNKIAQAGRASAIFSLWKIYKCLLHKITRAIMLPLVNKVHEKTSQTRQTKFESMRMLFIICTHLCYMRMHSLISQSELHNFVNLNFNNLI